MPHRHGKDPKLLGLLEAERGDNPLQAPAGVRMSHATKSLGKSP